MAGRWVYPLDPECPKVEAFHRSMDEDPMNDCVPGDVLGDIAESFERQHRAECERCQKFGCENVDVEY